MVNTPRTLETSQGPISYTLVRKAVKRLNLRITPVGDVVLTVPRSCTRARAEEFLSSKAGWVLGHLERLKREHACELPPQPPREECIRLLKQALERMYPLVEPYGVALPELKVRKMRTQWGNCHWAQGYITLNTVLARCPEDLRDYVALHELIHVLHHDHGPGFYARMDDLMPDWKERRLRLRGYGGALMEPEEKTKG